jgi:hypothetical protein
MLMIYLPVPADFVYSAPPPLLPLSVQYFSASLSKKLCRLKINMSMVTKLQKADIQRKNIVHSFKFVSLRYFEL